MSSVFREMIIIGRPRRSYKTDDAHEMMPKFAYSCLNECRKKSAYVRVSFVYCFKMCKLFMFKYWMCVDDSLDHTADLWLTIFIVFQIWKLCNLKSSCSTIKYHKKLVSEISTTFSDKIRMQSLNFPKIQTSQLRYVFKIRTSYVWIIRLTHDYSKVLFSDWKNLPLWTNTFSFSSINLPSWWMTEGEQRRDN